jgi:uncharacterized protein DUF1592/uncharacterized protein DUF1588/uncharacterized protein DUF1595/uncharacterized protein DUF1585/uncharacterized protein DUF1587
MRKSSVSVLWSHGAPWSVVGFALAALLVSAVAGCSGTIGENAEGHGVPPRRTTGTGSGTTSGGTTTGSGTTTGGTTGAGGSTGVGGSTGTGGSGTGGSGTGGSGTGGSTGIPPGGPTACPQAVPPTSQLPRLTRAEFDNTTRDLLGIDVKPSAMLAPDTIGSVDQRAWTGYQTAADSLATQVMASPTARAKVIPCAPSGDGAACAEQFIEQFGQRAFRRPLTAAEVARFQALFTKRTQITATGTFDEIAQVILKAFLESPSFLTRAEISETTPDGANFALNSYEMASRLSYMIWGTMPDDALFTAAAANKLSATADILAHAQRMLKDPKARVRIAEFHDRYALMGEATRWSEASHDPVAFPAFKPGMAPLLMEEAKRFFDYITFDQAGTFQDLLTKPVAFVNKDLAPIYGLNAGSFGPDLQLTNLDPAQRSGIFTHVGFLASYSSYERSSPILRGAFIEKQVLCREIPPPPPDAFNAPLPTTGATNREQVTAQTSGGACASCHATIVNPPGFALEAYDSIGSFQTKERTTGAPIDSVADVMIGSKTVRVAGPADLMAQIAASSEGQSCYAQRLMSYAYERELKNEDNCTVQTLAGRMAQSSYTLLNLITDLTQTQAFRVRAKVQP